MDENKKENESTPIMLDGKAVSQNELNEARNNPSVRIIENGENSYKTLQRLQG